MSVSVIVPCHNAEPYLAQAIGSALDQSRPPHEIIVIDDGSTDGSLALARRFAAGVPGRVRAFSERLGGAPRARNLGALLAAGDALMFLDADDVLGGNTIEALTSALMREPGGVAICPWFRLAYDDHRWVKQPPSCAPRDPGQDALSAWLTGWYHPPCSVLWSRAAFEQAGRWDEQATLNQDGDLMMRALATGIPLVESASGAGYYRRAREGASLSGTRLTRGGVAGRLRTVRKIAFLLEERGQLNQYRTALRSTFSRIASDADGHHADLAAQARALARWYGPSVWARAAGRVLRAVRRRRGSGHQRTRPLAPPEEVRYGLDRAEVVLRAQPVNASLSMTSAPDPFYRPLVSVIIPTFNRGGLLPRSLDSALAQTWHDFEILIVDDGSTDNTATVVSRYQDTRVRYLRQERNAGAGAARNRGLREARGELIAFLDSDDEWFPDKLGRQVVRFRELPDDVGLIYTGVESVREDGTRTLERPRDRGDVYREMLGRNVIHGGGSNVMIRREVVATVGFFHEGIPAIEDYEYWLRITRFFKVDFVDAPLIRYYDPPMAERRSLARQANLDARWWFYRKHAAEMRRARMAHLFLLKSMRRALKPPQPDLRSARRLAARAVLEAPMSRLALMALIRTMLAPPRRLEGEPRRSGWSRA